MVQDFLDSAKINATIEDMKVKGELAEFTARKVVELSVRVERLPCVNDRDCPTPVKARRIASTIATGAGMGSAGGAIVILADYLLSRLAGG